MAKRTTKIEWLLEKLFELEESPTQQCVEWPHCVDTQGYGTLSAEGRMWLVSRLAFAYMNGPITEDWFVLHTCDNPRCFNPEHLFPGTREMNAMDMTDKRRQAAGENNPGAKLTEAEVRHIRELDRQGVTKTAIAAQFGMGRTQITRIVRGRHWKRVGSGAEGRSVE